MAVEEVENTTEEVGTLAAEGLASTHYPLAPGYRVNVRSGPGTNFGVVRILPAGTRVPINCQTPGTRETGPYGTSNIWDNIGNGQFISDTFVKTGSDGYFTVRCA
ncbi:peptidase [Streptomyces sp. AcH 505]|uniref:peptidase n=1 Tax=Streptomyces sp. AcH 505 TaxID=352211 RepID=UPI000591A8B3|nr:peptidase [Streptomyces sp. AcH 505]